jgi:hypothetical protein
MGIIDQGIEVATNETFLAIRWLYPARGTGWVYG